MPMSRRDFLRRLAASAAAAVIRPARGQQAEAVDRPMPNLVWIMTDQQPVNTLRCYGNPHVQTPLTDALARRGTRLTNFHLSAFPCGPSRACLLTGRECHNAGVTQNDVTLPGEVPTIGDLLSAAGYRMGYFGKWHLSGNMYRGLAGAQPEQGNWQKVRRPSDEGFFYDTVPGGTGEDEATHGFGTWVGGWRHYHEYLRAVGLGSLLEQRRGNLGNHNIAPSGPDGQHSHSLVPAEHHVERFIAQRAAEFVAGRREDPRPFGCVVSFYGPHHPVAPPQPWDEAYRLDLAAPPPNHRDDLSGKPYRQRQNSECYVLPQWTEEQFRGYIRRYWGFVSYIESCAQLVLDALESTGRADDTIVLWTSDHGDMVGAHGMIHKLGFCGYEELLNVPLLLSYPGVVRAGWTSAALASTVDLVPTLLELMGLAAPEGVDGRSFAPVLRGESAEHRDTIVANWMGMGLVARTATHKLVLNHRPRDLDELYDLTTDPGELHNLAGTDAARTTQDDLLARLDAWLTETRHPYAGQVRSERLVSVEDTLCLARPRVIAFTYLGGDEFELTYEWAVEKPLPYGHRCWCFAQFVRGQTILFRNTTWPDPPTTAWQAGDRVVVGPVKLAIPDGVAGELTMRLGLWDPEARVGPGTMVGPHAAGNAFEAWTLRVTRQDGRVTGVELRER